jgi:plasmid maintenance system antidote protein VapI
MKPKLDASRILDELRVRRDLRSDAALGRVLGVGSPAISKLRAGKPLGASVIVRISERFDLTATEIYELGR